jgi:putative hydrolases of HD superfamily
MPMDTFFPMVRLDFGFPVVVESLILLLLPTMSSSLNQHCSTPFQYVTFLTQICGKLKDIKRTGWIRSGIPFPESDADHMHRCAMCAMLLFSPFHHENENDEEDDSFALSRIDPNKVLKMALTHDVCEALAGDITPHCSNLPEKEAKEEAAMEAIRNLLGDPLGKELYDLWREYEDQRTLEAIYCKDIDKLEMILQAMEYEEKYLQHHPLSITTTTGDTTLTTTNATSTGTEKSTRILVEPLRGFFQSTRGVFRTPLFQRMDQDIRQRREALLIQRGWTVTEEEQAPCSFDRTLKGN